MNSLPIVFMLSGSMVTALSLLALGLHVRQRRQRRLELTHTLHQLRLLRQLIAALQRHRGLSNGVLNGDSNLLAELAQTRQTVDQHMQQSLMLSTTQREAWDALLDHWSRLRQSGHLTPENNLTQHSLLIRNSLYLLEDIAVSADLTKEHPALHYVAALWRDLVPATEWAGQARALGTGLAAQGNSTAEQRVRLRFLYQKIEQSTQRTFTLLQDHAHRFPESTLSGVNGCAQAVNGLLACIDRDLLQGTTPTIAAPAFFAQATKTIDRLFAVVDAALGQLERAHNISL